MMRWNKETRQYEDARGNPIPPAQIRQEVDDWIKSEQSEVDKKSEAMLAGSITVAAFFHWLKDKITSMHGTSGVVAYGGEAEMNDERWGRVGEKLASEIAYLENFQRQVEEAQKVTQQIAADVARLADRNPLVPSGLDSVVESAVTSALRETDAAGRMASVADAIESALADSIGTEAEQIGIDIAAEALASRDLEELIWGQISSRSQSYADKAWATYANNEKSREADAGLSLVQRICEDDSASCDICPDLATDDYVPFDEVTDIGDGTMCQCRCYFVFSYAGVEGLTAE